MEDSLQAENTALPTLAVTLGAAIWGIYWWPLRYIEQLGMSGLWAVVLASSVPLVILLPLLVYFRNQSRNRLGTILIIGLFSGSAVTFYSIGLIHTTVVRATLLFYLTPIWSTLIGISLLDESVKWNRWMAIALGLVGLYFIVGDSSSESQPVNIGDWFGLASGICWGIAAVLIKRNPDIGVTVMVGWQHLFAFLVALTCCVMLSDSTQIPAVDIWIDAIPVMMGYSWLGLVPSLFAIFWASARLFPGRVGILMMTEVLVAMISAAILLDESVLALEWLGVILIISAGILEVLGSDKAVVVVER
ncbi:MAG: DMT family transporter [Gammaproteobacteria bacterium]|nr:DMT family transporter [Gammaproteobacteria bacterium]